MFGTRKPTNKTTKKTKKKSRNVRIKSLVKKYIVPQDIKDRVYVIFFPYYYYYDLEYQTRSICIGFKVKIYFM